MFGEPPRKIAGQKDTVQVPLYQFESGQNSVNHTVYRDTYEAFDNLLNPNRHEL